MEQEIIDFLRTKGILANDKTLLEITFEGGKTVSVNELIQEFALTNARDAIDPIKAQLFQDLYMEIMYSPYRDNSDSFKASDEFKEFIQNLYKGSVCKAPSQGILSYRLLQAFVRTAIKSGITAEDLDKAIARGDILVEDLLPELISNAVSEPALFNQGNFVSGKKFHYPDVFLGRDEDQLVLVESCDLIVNPDLPAIGTVSNIHVKSGCIFGDIESDYDVGRLYPGIAKKSIEKDSEGTVTKRTLWAIWVTQKSNQSRDLTIPRIDTLHAFPERHLALLNNKIDGMNWVKAPGHVASHFTKSQSDADGLRFYSTGFSHVAFKWEGDVLFMDAAYAKYYQ